MLEISKGSWLEKVKINGQEFEIKIDTGAQLNVVPLSVCNELCLLPKQCNVNIEAYGGYKIKPVGVVDVIIENKFVKTRAEFAVVNYDTHLIIGLDDSSVKICRRNKCKKQCFRKRKIFE